MLDLIIPVYNEEENIDYLTNQILNLKIYNKIEKIIYVNDGSTDQTLEKINFLRESNNKIFYYDLQTRCGQSQAIFEGVRYSNSRYNIVIDGDGQIHPNDIDKIYIENLDKIKNNFSLISGIRINRNDNFIKKISSKVAFIMRKIILGDDCVDSSCPLRFFIREDFLKLPYFKNMHRFLPLIFKRENFNVHYVPINHKARHKGKSKYGINNRIFVGIFDLIGVLWLIKRKKIPVNK